MTIRHQSQDYKLGLFYGVQAAQILKAQIIRAERLQAKALATSFKKALAALLEHPEIAIRLTPKWAAQVLAKRIARQRI